MKNNKNKQRNNIFSQVLSLGLFHVLLSLIISSTNAYSKAIPYIWLGNGDSPKWSDKGNWTNEINAAFGSYGSEIIFDSPKDASFKFSGEDFALSFSKLSFTTNSSRVTLSFPNFKIGGSPLDNIKDGYIVDNMSRDGFINNQSTETQILVGNTTLNKDTVINTEKGNIIFKGDFDAKKINLQKKGIENLIIADSKYEIDNLEFLEGKLTLNNAQGEISRIYERNNWHNKECPSISLLNGSRLKYINVDHNFNTPYLARFYLSLKGKNDNNEPSIMDFNGASVNIIRLPVEIEDGGVITNVKDFVVYDKTPTNSSKGISITGGSIYADSFLFADANQTSGSVISNITFSITSTEETPSEIVLNNGNMYFCKYSGGTKDYIYGEVKALFSGAKTKVTGVNEFVFPVSRSRDSSLVIKEGARVYAKLFKLGYNARNTDVIVTGENTLINADDGIFGFASGEGDYCPTISNRLAIAKGARIKTTGPLWFASRTGGRESPASFNSLILTSGAKLETAGKETHIGRANGRDPVTDNSLRISGQKTEWICDTENLFIGKAINGSTSNNEMILSDGATVTGIKRIAIGESHNKRATKNKLVIRNGAKLMCEDELIIGANYNCRGNDYNNATFSNIVHVVGIPNRNPEKTVHSTLIVKNKPIKIGVSDNQGNKLDSNKLIAGRASRISCSSLHIGPTVNYKYISKDNALVLAGGEVRANNLVVAQNNGIEVNTSSSVNPLLVNGDVEFFENTFIKPISTNDAKPGTYRIMAWKGTAKGLNNIKLSGDVNQDLWKLDIKEDKKQILLYHLSP